MSGESIFRGTMSYIAVLALVQFVGSFSPQAGLWVGVVGVSAAFVWENMQP